jgi:hypothetical protein
MKDRALPLARCFATRQPNSFRSRCSDDRTAARLAEVEGRAGHVPATTRHAPGAESAPFLKLVLAARNFGDPAAPEFGQTKYSKWLTLTDAMEKPRPMRTIAFYLAHMPPPLVRGEDRPRFEGWMDVNQRQYDPSRDPYFLPGPFPQRISKAHIWHNGHMLRFPQPSQRYFTYLAAELDDAFVVRLLRRPCG